MSKDYSGQSFTQEIHHDTYATVDPAKANLDGKYVYISGASKGLGKALALSYAKGGASGIALGARSDLKSVKDEILKAAKEAGRKEPKVVTASLDVSDLASAQAAAKATQSVFPKLDILINNAGASAEWLKIGQDDPVAWWNTWEINVKGVYHTTIAFLPFLLADGDKTVINVSSVGAHVVAPGASAYQTTKLAVCRFSEFITRDYVDEGLFSYSVHPGGVLTELASRGPEWLKARLNDTPELSADTIVWLTAERRDWLAGRYVSCNWDMEQFLEKKDEIIKEDLLKVKLAI